MSRAWCILEFFSTKTLCTDKLFETAAMLAEGSQQYADGSVVPAGPALRQDRGAGHKEMTLSGEGWFPESVVFAGMNADIANAQATRAEDKKAMLNIIAEFEDRSSEPPTQCEGYDKVNSTVRNLFLGAALYTRAKEGDTAGLEHLLGFAGADVNDQRSDACRWRNSALSGGI